MTDSIRLTGRRALVTGASGFIGSALCRALRALGAVVTGVSRTAVHSDDCDRWLCGDLSELDDVRRLLKATQADLVFHLASCVTGGRGVDVVPATFQANLASSVNLLTATTEIGGARLIMTGSLEEPDPSGGWPIPASPYAAAKFAASTYGRMFHQLYQTPVTLLRLFMVYGPGQRDMKKLVPYVTSTLLDGRVPELSSGQRMVDWIYVDDVVRAYIAAAVAANIEGKTFDIGSGTLVSVRTVVEQLAQLADSAIVPRFGAIAERPFEQERVANVGATALALNWQPRVELKEGLSRTIAWYRARHGQQALAT